MHTGEILVLILIGFAVVGAIGYALSVYNGLVGLKKAIARSWANIDALLRQRCEELPKLVTACEAHMRHEREILDHLSVARDALAQAHTVGQRAIAESRLNQLLGRLFALAETYPALKSDPSFLELQHRISDLENQIADRREFYNDAVTTFNTRIREVPDIYAATWLGLDPAELFEVSESDRQEAENALRMTG